MKQKRVKFFITTVALLLSFWSFFASAAVVATVSANKVTKGEVFVLKLVSDRRVDSDAVDFSPLNENFYTGRPSFSSSFNNINGKRSVRSEWTLSLAPLRAGELTIPPIDVDGELTEAVKIIATVDPSSPTQEDLVEYQAKLSSNEIYPGEIARLDTRLILKTSARRVQSPEFIPPLSSQEVEIEAIGEANQYLRVIDGVEATIIDQSYQLTSQEPGSYIVSGPGLKAKILDGSGRSGSSRLIPVDLAPVSIPLTILAKPEGYQGVWLPSPGLTLSQNWLGEDGSRIGDTDQLSANVGAPVTREITLTAEGISPAQLPDIKITYPEDIRLYEEPAKITSDNNTVTMKVKHVLIPKKEGKTELPGVSINWWNTKTKSGERESLSGLTLSAGKSETPSIQLNEASLPRPSTPQIETETITVKDSGIWPYLTALFALMWIVTLATLFRMKRKRETAGEIRSQRNSDGPESASLNALIAAIRERDCIAAQAKLNEWLVDTDSLNPEVRNVIEEEMDAMMASAYSSTQLQWDDSKLIKALKQSRKALRNNSGDGRESLAAL